MPFDNAYAELRKFVTNYRLLEIFEQNDLEKSFKKSFKRTFPILIIERAINQSPPWKDKIKNENFSIYLKEAISDILQSFLLATQGMYKPGHLSLRSGLENFVKCIGLSQDQNVLSLTSVYELMDVVKDTAFISKDTEARKLFQTLRAEYTSLCGHVHTSSSMYMALTTVVGVFPRYVPNEAQKLLEQITRVSSAITKILILLFPNTFKLLHYKHHDAICDVLPKSFKRYVNVQVD
ncbi:hypothetical protein N7E70_010840 [Aminobacter sp. NyZ550]|uniref:hypothetical protein n=1 Tax=Aminobacter sp. NyZ550 TaxID=2979870 RepID=UPI0021D5FAB3|nr:hypothetical protein [Aminobacter sp. NyZ550]WAX97307.1 hypothetical protein N7E70_010840 [Aminobacter sp. NyZ550]